MKRYMNCLWAVMKREFNSMILRPLYVFCMIIAPLCCYVFFTTLMGNGLPVDLPVAVVDNDNTTVTRNIIRNLDSFQQTKIVAQYASVAEARNAMQRGEIYAFYYIPAGTTESTLRSEQPRVSFYTNGAYLIAGSLLYRDMKMMSELASAAVARETLYAKGVSEDAVMGILQPIKIDMHAINNPWLNYSVYLCNTLLPGVLLLMVMLVTIYAIYNEQKVGTVREWLDTADNHIGVAVLGKLLPQTAIFILMAVLYNIYLFGYLHFPINSGIWPMLLASSVTVIAGQALALFICGAIPSMRWCLSLATLWGVLSFPISGFSFPVTGMPAALHALSYLFPLRYYFLIYVDQALNGRPMGYSWFAFLALLLFILLPLTVIKRLHYTLENYEYIP